MGLPTFELTVATKHIVSRKRQTVLSVAAVGLAVAIAVVIVSIQNGFQDFLFEIVLKNIPHVTVTPPEGEEYIHLYRNVVERIWVLEGVVAVSPALVSTATIAHEGEVENVAMMGVIPSQADEIGSVTEDMVHGDLYSILGKNKVVMGQALADNLEVRMGDTLEASFPDARTTSLVVSGIFDTGYEPVDEGVVYVSLDTARDFVGEGDVITSIDVKLKDIFEAKAVAEKMSAFGYRAESWQELYPQILRTVAFERIQNMVTLALILIIAAFGIANVMNMLVLEKTREIGMLMAAGADRSQIRWIFLMESGLLGLVGALCGSVLGLAACLYLGTLQIPASPNGEMIYLPILIDPADFLTFTLVALALSVMAGVYPAHKASRLDPVEALKG